MLNVVSMWAGREKSAMKLTIKAKQYKLNTACGCSKLIQGNCGVNYRVG